MLILADERGILPLEEEPRRLTLIYFFPNVLSVSHSSLMKAQVCLFIEGLCLRQ